MLNKQNDGISSKIEKRSMPSITGIALSVVLILIIFLSIAAIIYIGTTAKSGERFTEFYILNLDSKADNYPTKVTANEEVFVVLGIVNKEQITTKYRLEILIDGQVNNEEESILLNDNEKWEEIVSFTPMNPGDNQKVEFLLYRQEQDDPYLSLYLWIDVIQE